MRITQWTITVCLTAFCAVLAIAFAASVIGDAVANASASAAERRVRPSATHRRSRAPLYNGSEPTISQISPAIRRARQPSLRFHKWLRSRRHRAWQGRSQRPSLADALLSLPTPASESVLREAGAPVVPGVPPIVILEPRSKEDRDRDLAIRSQQQ
jgi:hypothetical protein